MTTNPNRSGEPRNSDRGAAPTRNDLEAILSRDPDNAGAIFHLARMDLLSDPSGAAERVLSAIERGARDARLPEIAAEAVRRADDPDLVPRFMEAARIARVPKEAVSAAKARLDAPPIRLPRSSGKLKGAEAALAKGRIGEAARRADEVLKSSPTNAAARWLRARARARIGEHDAAIRDIGAAIAAEPGCDGLHARLATWLQRNGSHVEATASARAALRLNPDNPEAWIAIGQAAEALRDTSGALMALRRAVQILPASRAARVALGKALHRAKRPGEAREAFERAARDGRPDAPLLLDLAETAAMQGNSADARKYFDKALELEPKNVFIAERAAAHLQSEADPGADALYRRAIGLSNRPAPIIHGYGLTTRIAPDDPLAESLGRVWTDPERPPSDRAAAGFALSRIHENAGNAEAAASYLAPANALVMEAERPEPWKQRDELDELIGAFEGFGGRTVDGAPTADPIFVTGMPRSGTTLIEQILASHPDVTAIGETGFFATAATRLMRKGDGFRGFAELKDGELAELGHAYMERVDAYAPGAGRVADKSILTWSVIGLVNLALPRARVLVLDRDPRDTLLSIWKNKFAPNTNGFAYDIDHLVAQYGMFRRMTAFWERAAPGGFVRVSYENLVSDPEPRTRDLVAAAGLSWDDACLSPQKTERRVTTLSVGQVRRPIYKTSLRSWEKYGAAVAPLIEAIDKLEAEPDVA